MNLNELKDSLANSLSGGEKVPDGHCIRCKEPFTHSNVFTSAGWRETKISKMCESCFDAIFEGIDDER